MQISRYFKIPINQIYNSSWMYMSLVKLKSKVETYSVQVCTENLFWS